MKKMLLCCLILAGCTQTRYISVPEYHREYVVRTDSVMRTDSVVIKDSVLLYTQGDTVYKEAWRDRLVWRDRWRVRTDTVTVRDSIRVEVSAEVEKPSAWARWKGRVWHVLLILAIAATGALVFRWVWKRI